MGIKKASYPFHTLSWGFFFCFVVVKGYFFVPAIAIDAALPVKPSIFQVFFFFFFLFFFLCHPFPSSPFFSKFVDGYLREAPILTSFFRNRKRQLYVRIAKLLVFVFSL